MPHETPETLSALIDGELSSPDAERARAHAVACPDCGAVLARFEGASSAFRRSGEHAMPVGLAARVKAHAKPRRSWPIRLGLVAAFGVILLLLGGVAVKSLMPTLFNNIQQMITGAAGQMGSGGK